MGMTLDVATKKGLKKRFFVEHIEAQGSKDGMNMLTITDSTKIKLDDKVED